MEAARNGGVQLGGGGRGGVPVELEELVRGLFGGGPVYQQFQQQQQQQQQRRQQRRRPEPPASFAEAARRARDHPVVQMVDLKLAFKLALVVVLLGQDGDSGRFAVLTCLAFAAFLHQTGLARALLSAARAPGAAATAAEAEERAQTAEEARVRQQQQLPEWSRVLGSLARGLIAPSDANGPLTELALLFATFALSLAPTWRPHAIQPAPADPSVHITPPTPAAPNLPDEH